MILKITNLIKKTLNLKTRFKNFRFNSIAQQKPQFIARSSEHADYLRFNKLKAPWHLVDPSPWPLIVSMLLFSLTTYLVAYMHCYDVSYAYLILTVLNLTYALLSWGRDVVVEGTFQGHHNSRVRRGFIYGIILFILSEVMFFFSFFWAFFHSALIPSHLVGGIWPPIGILPLNPRSIALSNTALLLTSGLTITWAHWSILCRKREESLRSLFWTIVLGTIFLGCQFYEYLNCPFSIADGIFGSCFFMITGLHGVHVFLGTILLLISFFRQLNYHFTQYVHVGFLLSVWYWHFVDGVWIFVYIFLYYWSDIHDRDYELFLDLEAFNRKFSTELSSLDLPSPKSQISKATLVEKLSACQSDKGCGGLNNIKSTPAVDPAVDATPAVDAKST